MKQKRYKKGHFFGLGIAIGIPLGMPIGLALGNIGIGPAIGAIIGIPIGFALEKKNNPHPIPLTKEEKRKKKKIASILIGAGIILFSIFAMLFFFAK